MKELRISDFKMFEYAPYELPKPKSFTELMMIAIKEMGKMYGPVFDVKFIKNALAFVAKKIGEEPSQDIKNLDQLAEYIISVSNKYSTAYCAIPYAGFKTEKELQGRTGAGTQLGAMSISRSVVKGPSREKRNIDLDSLLSKYRQTLIEIGAAPHEMGYRKNEDESVDLIWPKCYLKDGCRMAFDEGVLTRVVGGLQCSHCAGILQLFKLFTSYDWDYKLLEFDKPYCIANIYMI